MDEEEIEEGEGEGDEKFALGVVGNVVVPIAQHQLSCPAILLELQRLCVRKGGSFIDGLGVRGRE